MRETTDECDWLEGQLGNHASFKSSKEQQNMPDITQLEEVEDLEKDKGTTSS